MGEIELKSNSNELIIHSVLFFYGNASSDALSFQIAKDISRLWNGANAAVLIRKKWFRVLFDIRGYCKKDILPEVIFSNTDPRNNYFRIEAYSSGDISFVDGVNSNTGYFKLGNLAHPSTTAAHEYGHTIGLDHPRNMDIRGKGVPGIMHPRGTWVDPPFQYSPVAKPGEAGGTMNPVHRRVTQQDIDHLKLHEFNFDRQGPVVLGNYSAIYHEAHTSN